MKIVRLLILTFISVFFAAGLVFAASCSVNAMYCNDAKLCKEATREGNSGPVWDTRQKTAQHVAEAKRRALNCGRTKVLAKKNCAVDASIYADSQICIMTVSYDERSQKVWSLTLNPSHVIEAKHRA